MGYINYKILYEKGLSDSDFHLLQKVFQKDIILIEPFLDDLRRFKSMDLIQYLKGKEEQVEGLRISKKGNELLNQLSTIGYNDYIGELINKLIDLYKASNKHVGTKLEVQSRLIWFIENTGFSNTVIFKSVEEYLLNNTEYTKSLENLIWSPPSKAFSVHKNLKDSKLYDFICEKYNLDVEFYLKNEKSKEMNWLYQLSKLEVPKNLDKSLYFKGDAFSDFEHISNMKKEYLKRITIESNN